MAVDENSLTPPVPPDSADGPPAAPDAGAAFPPPWSLLEGTLLGGIAALGFAATLFSGLRGVFPLDQSIVFDGGWRVFSGQVPYRDFHLPFGPVSLWYQAGLFHLFGLNYTAYALGAAIQGAVGAACVFLMLRTLLPRELAARTLGAALTAVWLCAPFGTTYPEQTAFTLVLVGATLLAAANRVRGTRGAASLAAAAGMTAVLAVLAKHNAGILSLAVYGAIAALSAPDRRRLAGNVAGFVFGAGAAASLFAVWLHSASDPAAFHRCVLEIPCAVGRDRIAGGGLVRFARYVLTSEGGIDVRIACFAGAVLGMIQATLALIDRSRRRGTDRRPPGALGPVGAALFTATLLGVQNLFSLTSNNDPGNERPFLGLLFGLGLAAVVGSARDPQAPRLPRWTAFALLAAGGLLSAAVWSAVPILGTLAAVLAAEGLQCFQAPCGDGRWSEVVRLDVGRTATVAAAAGLFVYLFALGASVAAFRLVHESFPRAAGYPHLCAAVGAGRFEAAFSAPALAGLRWGAPTVVGRTNVPAEEVEALVTLLRERGEPFFVFPDFTFLYAAAEVPSPQPVLWFHKGLTYPACYCEALDAAVVASLRRHGVETVVLESDAHLDVQARLDDFPLLRRYIETEFAYETRLGFFVLRRALPPSERRPYAPPTSGPALPALAEAPGRGTLR